MSYLLRQTLGLESAEIFSPSTVIIEQSEVSSEVEMVNEVQEMEEASSVILKASSDIDLVETSVATLEGIMLTLEVSMENHSLNNTNLAMAYVTLEHIEQSLGLESGTLTVAMESDEAAAEGGVTMGHIKNTASDMWGKVKSMLSQLKDAGSKLFDKMVEQYHVFTKNTAQIAARVKDRINTLKSNINMANKGGEKLKIKSLRQLTGAAASGTVTGRSFLSALDSTVAQTATMSSNFGRYDALSALVAGLKIGSIKSGGMNIKQLSEFGKHVNEVCKNRLQTESDSVKETYGSDVFINGNQLIMRRFSEAKLYELLKTVVNDISTLTSYVSLESDGEQPDDFTGEGDDQPTSKFAKLKAKAKEFKETFNAKIASLGISKAAAISALIALCAFAGGGVAVYYALSTLFISTAEVIICAVVAAALGGISAVSARNTVKALAGGNTEVAEQLDETISLENYTVSMEAAGNLKDSVLALQTITAEFNIIKVNKADKSVMTESMSGKDIKTACDMLTTVADNVIAIAAGSSKTRVKAIKEYVNLAKKGKNYYTTGKDESIASGCDTVNYIKSLIELEVDYCKSMNGVLIGSIAYLEASNNAAPAES